MPGLEKVRSLRFVRKPIAPSDPSDPKDKTNVSENFNPKTVKANQRSQPATRSTISKSVLRAPWPIWQSWAKKQKHLSLTQKQ